MNNLGIMYRYEMRKIFCRRITMIVLIIVTLIMIAMNIGEYVVGRTLVNVEEQSIVGRVVDETLLMEMQDAMEPRMATMEDGETICIGVNVKDRTYEPLMNYLYMLGGNYDKAYSMTEQKLYRTFVGIVDTNMEEQYLTQEEKAYWNNRREKHSEKLVYGKIQNGWGDSVIIIYVVSLLTLIAIAATLSGIFSEETSLKTDALIFSSVNGKKRLVTAKILAGITAGMLETIILLLACVGTEFAISGFEGANASIQFFVGPTAMDMTVQEALFWSVGIMMVLGIFFSIMTMCLSQICHNSIATISILMFMWLLSMINMPDSLGLLARIWNFLFPVTFLGSWTFTDYHLVPFLGKFLTVIQAAPIIYAGCSIILAIATKLSYNRYQVKGR